MDLEVFWGGFWKGFFGGKPAKNGTFVKTMQYFKIQKNEKMLKKAEKRAPKSDVFWTSPSLKSR